MEQKKEVVFCPVTYQVSLTLVGGRPGGQLRPVIGAVIPKQLARRLELDSDRAWLQRDGQDGQIMVRGRSNDVCQEFRLPVEELNLKARQKKQLGF